MVSSDCTGARPICAIAFMAGAAAVAVCSLACWRLDCFCFFCSAGRVTASFSSACANAAPDDINANENADAPKTKARECLTPKAILPQPVVCFLAGWRAPLIRAAACWLQIFTTGPPAGIASALVTPRYETGQSSHPALYIDCKVQWLDCAPIELYKRLIGNRWEYRQLWRHLQETTSEAPESMPKVRPRRPAFSP